MDGFNSDQGWRGPFSGGTAPGEEQGRMNGGGWVDGPMPLSVDEGKGVWEAPIGADPQSYMEDMQAGNHPGGSILTMVEGWPSVFES